MPENDRTGRDSPREKGSLAAEMDAIQRLHVPDFSTRLLGTNDVSIMMGHLLQAVLAIQSCRTGHDSACTFQKIRSIWSRLLHSGPRSSQRLRSTV